MYFAKTSTSIAIFVLFGTAPAWGGDHRKGELLFQERCAMCHGSNGRAILPGAPSFAKGERLEKPDNVLTVSVKEGRNAMPPFRGVLTDGQIGDILSYIRRLRR